MPSESPVPPQTTRERLEAIKWHMESEDRDAARDLYVRVHEHAVAALAIDKDVMDALLKAWKSQDWRFVSDAINLMGGFDPVAGLSPSREPRHDDNRDTLRLRGYSIEGEARGGDGAPDA